MEISLGKTLQEVKGHTELTNKGESLEIEATWILHKHMQTIVGHRVGGGGGGGCGGDE